LRVVHPKTDDGDVGYSGGIWRNPNKNNHKSAISLSFSFSETKGIYHFKLWRDRCDIRFDFVDSDGKISFEKLKEMAIKEYGIEMLFQYE